MRGCAEKGDTCCNKGTAVNSAGFLLWLCPHAHCSVRVSDGKQDPILCWSVDCIWGLCRRGCFQVKIVSSCQVSTVCLRRKSTLTPWKVLHRRKTPPTIGLAWKLQGFQPFMCSHVNGKSFQKLRLNKTEQGNIVTFMQKCAGMTTPIVTPD